MPQKVTQIDGDGNVVGGTTANAISTNNARAAATLAAGAVYQGTGEDVSLYGRAGIAITSTNASDGVLTIETSHDNVTWGGPTRTWSNTSIAQPHMWNIVEKYFRIKYTNGTTEATGLSIQVQYSNTADTLLGHQLDEVLMPETEALAVRSVAVGQDQSDVYRNISVVNQGDKTSLYTVSGFTDTQTVHLDVVVTSSPMSYMLIDLSDTTNWKHTNTGEIILEYMMLQIDPGSTFAGEVRIGYLKNVDATNGDFVTLFDVDMKKQASLLVEVLDFGAHGMHCNDNQHFGPVDANDTAYQTDINLGGPDDPTTTTYPSGNGDLVMQVNSAGAGNAGVDISVTLGYETASGA